MAGSRQDQGIGGVVSPVSTVALGRNSNVSVALGDLNETSLLLCQTSQASGSAIDGDNTFMVVELASKITLSSMYKYWEGHA